MGTADLSSESASLSKATAGLAGWEALSSRRGVSHTEAMWQGGAKLNDGKKVCKKCNAGEGQRYLEMCSICREYFCRVCAMHRHGKRFCGPHCADLFYFGDLDDE